MRRGAERGKDAAPIVRDGLLARSRTSARSLH
jgi:hypothetical protein